MGLPSGFQFVIDPEIPPAEGLRKLNDKTFAVRPDCYERLVKVFGSLDQLGRVLRAFGAMAEAAVALGRLAEALG